MNIQMTVEKDGQQIALYTFALSKSAVNDISAVLVADGYTVCVEDLKDEDLPAILKRQAE